MNPVEIEEAVSSLALEPFDATEFPFQFLRAFGNKETAIQRLRAGNTNQSDVAGAILQRGNIHIATCMAGSVDDMLRALRDSPKTASQKAKFILATDGEVFQAEDMNGGGTVVCAFADFHDHFGFFLPLAGITTVEQIRESSFDIKATGRLNKLYIELLKNNPEWAVQREAMNHFMARLIFCFFAEDTDIFVGKGLFSKTIEQMSARDASDTHIVMGEIFRAMDVKIADRASAGVKRYADAFPYVNGQLFSGSTECPRFSKVARSYLLHIASLNWQKINPDIFGSMIQAVADDEERGALGMHYTSVPNILKVLNPLFLNDLHAALAEAGNNERKLLNLRKRLAKIRVFDPACGSGNFLVIAYKEMRAIEAEINRRRDEVERRSDVPLTNFRGIELRDFPAEIARLALIIAEYQCDVTYRGQQEALAEFLPLDSQNWITRGNALQVDWLSICPPTGTRVKLQGDDLFSTPLDQAQIDFENEGGETYICGNPPFSGFNSQSADQKRDLSLVLSFTKDHKYFDYVSGWFWKATQCLRYFNGAAFVSTSSIVEGVQVPILWKPIISTEVKIHFCHLSFIWSNNAANNAGVSCVIIGLTKERGRSCYIYSGSSKQHVDNITPYLSSGDTIFVERSQKSIANLPPISTGNVAYDGGHFILTKHQRDELISEDENNARFVRPLIGSKEFIRGESRFCVWTPDEYQVADWKAHPLSKIFYKVQSSRLAGGKIAKNYSDVPYRFYMVNESNFAQIIAPRVCSERRNYLTVGFIGNEYIISDSAQAIYNSPLWVLSVISSKLHMAWVRKVGGYLGTSIRYSAIMCYNTFPVPTLTDQNRADLTRCAEDILLAREAHFPATIADLYDPQTMPEDLRAAHDRNDEVLERIYIGRCFRNDTERLEKLFELYTKMTAKGKAS